jgi:hypothetical protein
MLLILELTESNLIQMPMALVMPVIVVMELLQMELISLQETLLKNVILMV